ncbi:MAG: hypothetical protein M1825_002228 [Sarcosagium campestre]|nr:MAG: hypothetical protein M1825_002228 [Sarcosagium campestre]
MSRTLRDLSSVFPRSQGRDSDQIQTNMLRKTFPAGQDPRICVVGAGMAGLRCAEVLLNSGFEVTILEARDRIGGRIHQLDHMGHMIDMGPNWIHGTHNNPILELAKASNASLHSWTDGINLVHEGGQLLPQEQGELLSEQMWSIVGDAFRHSHENCESISPRDSLFDYFKSRNATDNKRKELHTSQYNPSSPIDRQRLLWAAEMWGSFVGDAVQRQSLKFFWLEECIEGENLFLSSTYKSVLDRVARIPLQQANIELGKAVIKIESSLEHENSGSRIRVTTKDGKQYQFDEVVVTTPLGWLKKNLKAFEPPISPRITQAIQSISYGNLEKVYLTFHRAFWQDSVNQDEPNEQRQTFSDFTQWIHPTYAAETNPDSWTQSAVNLAALEGTNAQPSLLFYIFGACSKHLTGLVASKSSVEQHQILDDFFRPYYSRLPNYDVSAPYCSPEGIKVTSWSTDEYAGFGSYCNFQVGLENADKDIEAMRNGMPERGVWLAGEHTAPFIAVGTTTGAYWSGEGVAERIVEAYRGFRHRVET